VSHDRHEGQTALVTGAAHGIGLGIATAFAEAGAAIVLADRDVATAGRRASELAERFNVKTLAMELDVRSAASVAAMLEQATAWAPRIDVLVNNAGVYPNSLVVEMSEEEWDQVFDTNVKGMFLVSRAVVRHMLDRGVAGRIVNISSGSAKSGRIGAAHYCASKAAVEMFTRVLALETAPHGIVVNAVAPGLIEVENAGLKQDYVDAVVAQTPMRRMGTPQDIAGAVLYLASPAATYITGATLAVDGGSLAGRASLPLSG
jgi:3-oxoacyl-[acyl-carrier protein] reductase